MSRINIVYGATPSTYSVSLDTPHTKGALTYSSPGVLMYVCISSTITNVDTQTNNATIHIDGATSIGMTKSSKSIWQRLSLAKERRTQKSEKDVPHPIAIVVETSSLGLQLCQHSPHIQFARCRGRPVDIQLPSSNFHCLYRASRHFHGCHCAYQRSKNDGSM